jgi:dephospho-CoA kinase
MEEEGLNGLASHGSCSMIVVGLTGGIASGKSTVAQMFRDTGIPVICADELAHDAVRPGKPALEDIRRAFGQEVIDNSGQLDRTAMARIVFRDPDKRRVLESIIHPRVAEEQYTRIAELEREGHTVVVVDVPLLYERNWEKAFDLVVVVYLARSSQEERLIVRDGLSIDDARARLNAQMSIEEKKERADRVVDNSGGVQHTHRQVMALVSELRELARFRASENKNRGTGSENSAEKT